MLLLLLLDDARENKKWGTGVNNLSDRSRGELAARGVLDVLSQVWMTFTSSS